MVGVTHNTNSDLDCASVSVLLCVSMFLDALYLCIFLILMDGGKGFAKFRESLERSSGDFESMN